MIWIAFLQRSGQKLYNKSLNINIINPWGSTNQNHEMLSKSTKKTGLKRGTEISANNDIEKLEHPYIPAAAAAAAAASLQSHPTLWDPIDSSLPGSPVAGILQARTLEWVAISFSNAWKWKVNGKLLSRARLLVTPWTAAYQAPLSMGFSRQEYWIGVPLPSPPVRTTIIKKNYKQ